MTDLRKAAEMALKDWLENHEGVVRFGMKLNPEWVIVASHGFLSGYEEALAQPEKPPIKSYCGGQPNYCTPDDAVPKFTVTEPRQSLSRMKPGDRFILLRTSEIYHIKKDGSQWNDTRQRPARLHKNSQVQLIVTHPKCDDSCMQVCTQGFTKPPTCAKPVDAVNMSKERVEGTDEHRHEPVAVCEYCEKERHVVHAPKREWVGLTDEEKKQATGWSVEHIEAFLNDKNT